MSASLTLSLVSDVFVTFIFSAISAFLALLSGSLSSSEETRGGVLSFRARRRKDLEIFLFLSIFRFGALAHALITKSSHELD